MGHLFSPSRIGAWVSIAFAILLGCDDSADGSLDEGQAIVDVQAEVSDDSSETSSEPGDGTDHEDMASDTTSNVNNSVGSVTFNQDCQLQGATCQEFTVTCPDLDPISVQISVFEPQGLQKGTVLVGSGGGGTLHYDIPTINGLRQKGFRVVDRVWAENWVSTDKGTNAAACRYATLLTWLREQPWTEGPLCVTGNSGGSAEISYALARWGRAEVIDFALPTSGPPAGRIDLGCVPSSEWKTQCQDLVPEVVCGGADVECEFAPLAKSLIDSSFEGTPCTENNVDMLTVLHGDSVVSPTSVYHYPNTPVHFLFGKEDCTSALPLGLLYAMEITSEVSIQFVQAAHPLFQSPEGSAAIISAMEQYCMEIP